MDLYKVDKKEACGQLLKRIERKMQDVTLHADNYEQLKSVFLARRMYLHPSEEKYYSNEEVNELTKRFANGFNHMKNEPGMKRVLSDIKQYREDIKSLGI